MRVVLDVIIPYPRELHLGRRSRGVPIVLRHPLNSVERLMQVQPARVMYGREWRDSERVMRSELISPGENPVLVNIGWIFVV